MWSPQFGDVAYMRINGWDSVIVLLFVHLFMAGFIYVMVQAFREKYRGYTPEYKRVPDDIEYRYYDDDTGEGAAITVHNNPNSPIQFGIVSSQWPRWEQDTYKWGPFTRKRTSWVYWTCSCGYGVGGNKQSAPKMGEGLFQAEVIREFERTHKHGD